LPAPAAVPAHLNQDIGVGQVNGHVTHGRQTKRIELVLGLETQKQANKTNTRIEGNKRRNSTVVAFGSISDKRSQILSVNVSHSMKYASTHTHLFLVRECVEILKQLFVHAVSEVHPSVHVFPVAFPQAPLAALEHHEPRKHVHLVPAKTPQQSFAFLVVG
jgi:hypothetical protein